MPRALCAVFVVATSVVVSDQARRAAAQTPAPPPQAPAKMTPGDAAVTQVIAHHLRELTEGQTRRTVKALDLLAGRAVGGGSAPFDAANFDVDGTVSALFAACDSFATTTQQQHTPASGPATTAPATDVNRYRASINSLYVNTTDGVGASLRCPVEGPDGVYSLASSGRLTGVRVPDRRLVPDFGELSTHTLETVYYLLRRPPALHTPRYPRYSPSSAAAAGSFDAAAEPWNFADGTGGGGVREVTDAVGAAAEAMIVADVCVAGDVDIGEAAYEPCVAAAASGAAPRRATVGVSFSFAETSKYLAAVVQGGPASARGGLRPVNSDGAFKGVLASTQTGVVYASSAGAFVDTQTGLPLNLFTSVVSWLTAGTKPALSKPVSDLVGAVGRGMKTLASENTRVLDGKEPNENDLQFMLRPDILQGIFNNECRRSTVAFSGGNCRGLLTKSPTVGDDITFVKAHYPRNSASGTSGNWSGAVPLTPLYASKSATRMMVFILSTQGGAVGVPAAATRLANVRNTLSNTVALTADAALTTLHSVAGAVADVYHELPRSDARVQALRGLAGLCTAGYFWNPHKAVEEGTVLRGVALATEDFFYYVRCGGAASRVAAASAPAGYAASQVAVANRTSGELRVWSGVHLTAGEAFDEAAATPVVTSGFDLEALEWWKDVKPPAPAGSAPNGGRNAAAAPVWSRLGATALGSHAAADGGSVLLARPLCAGGAAMPRRTPEEEAAQRSGRCRVFSGAVVVEADFSLLQEELNEHGGALGAGISKEQAATLAAGGTLSVPPLTAGVLLVTPSGDLVPVRSRSLRRHAEYDDTFVDDLPAAAHTAAQAALRAHAAAGNPGVLTTPGYSSVEASVPPNLPPNPPPHHPGVPSHKLPPCADVLTDPACVATLLYDTAALPLPAGGRVAASAAGAAGAATWKFVTWNPRAYINSYAEGSAGAKVMATMARLETVLYGTLATASATTEVQRHEDTLMRHAARLARAGVSLRDAQALAGGGGAAAVEDVSVPVDRVVAAQLATCEEEGGGDGATSVLLYQRQPAKGARYVRTRCAFGAGGRRVSVQANATAPLEEFVVAEHPGFAVQAGPVYVRPEYGAAARELAEPTLPEVPGRVAAGVNATGRVATLSLAAFPKQVEAAAVAATAGRTVARNMSTLGGLLTKPLCDRDPCPRCSSEECPEVHGYATAYVVCRALFFFFRQALFFALDVNSPTHPQDLSSVEAVLQENQYIIAAYAHMPNDTTALGPTDVTNLLSRGAHTLATGQQQGLDVTRPTVLVAASRGASLDVKKGTFISPLQSADAAVRETAALRTANATSGTVDGKAAWVVGVPLGWTLTEGRRPWELVVSVDYERYRRDHLNLVCVWCVLVFFSLKEGHSVSFFFVFLSLFWLFFV